MQEQAPQNKKESLEHVPITFYDSDGMPVSDQSGWFILRNLKTDLWHPSPKRKLKSCHGLPN